MIIYYSMFNDSPYKLNKNIKRINLNIFDANFNKFKNEILDYLNSKKIPKFCKFELFTDIKNELTLADGRKKGFVKYKNLDNYTGIYFFVHKITYEKIYIGEAGSGEDDSLMNRLNAQTTKGTWNNSNLLQSLYIEEIDYKGKIKDIDKNDYKNRLPMILESLQKNFNVVVFKIGLMDKKEYKYLAKALETYFIGYYEPIYNNTIKE